MKKLLAISAFLFASSAFAAPNLTGKWAIHNNIAGNENDAECRLVVTDNKITGSCKSQDKDLPVTGTVDGNKGTWQFQSDYNGSPITLIYKATLDDSNKIVGTVEVQPFGITGDFTATASSASSQPGQAAAGQSGSGQVSAVTGQWAVHNNFAGNENDLGCKLVATDNKITGSCKSQDKDLPVTGTVDGNKVTWQVQPDYNGSPITLIYKATLGESNKIAGTVEVKEFGMTGDFTAVTSSASSQPGPAVAAQPASASSQSGPTAVAQPASRDATGEQSLVVHAGHGKRPKITGLSHLAVYTSNPEAADNFYRKVLGAVKLSDPENPQGVRYALSDTQFIEVLPLPAGAGINRLDHSAWNTDNAEQLRRYLAVNNWRTPEKVEKGSDGSRWFEVLDPEGNKVQFVQLPPHSKPLEAPDAIGHHIIHIGFLVHSQESEDKFYRTLLDFRPYWWGGRKKGQVDWVSQQAPDSTDWLEYMLVADPGTGIPANMGKGYLGVLDHFSIGETSVDDTLAKLKESGRLAAASHSGGMPVTDRTQVGLDGKGQYNLFDPDGIRVEFMNFHHTTEPCCSPFTAPDPSK